MRVLDRLRAARDELGDVQPLGLPRLLVGFFIFRQALLDLGDATAHGWFGARFYLPLLPAALLPSARGWAALEALELVLGAAVVVGVAARPALVVSSLTGLYLLACDRLQYHHHTYALYLVAFLLAFSPCDRAWARGRRFADARQGPLWAARLVQLQLTIIYFASAGSKLADADWRGGLVLANRLARYGAAAVARGVPRFAVSLLGSPVGASLVSKGAIATELFIAVGIWLPRTRRLAALVGIAFHVAIDLTARVDIFSWLSIAVLSLALAYEVPGQSPSAAPARR